MSFLAGSSNTKERTHEFTFFEENSFLSTAAV